MSITGSNLGPLLKLRFFLLITANNNLSFWICCENIMDEEFL